MDHLNPASPIPLYRQFKQLVERKLATGEWPVDQPLPTEMSLVEAYGISRTTVRQAFDELVTEGRVFRQRGRGTFVAPEKITQTLARLTGFAEELALRGLKPEVRVVNHGLEPAPEQVARALGLGNGAEVLHIERLVRVEGIPLFHDDSYFPPGLLGVLSLDAVQSEPIYRLLEAAGNTPAEGEQSLGAIAIPPEVAAQLGVPAGAAGLQVTRVTVDALGKPMEFANAIYRGDRYHYTIRLQRTP